MERVGAQGDVSPPHQGHRNVLLRRTNPHWNEEISSQPLPSRPVLTSSLNTLYVPNQIAPDDGSHLEDEPHQLSEESIAVPSGVEARYVPQISHQDYNFLILEFPVSYNL